MTAHHWHVAQPVAQGIGADNRDGWEVGFPVLLHISGAPHSFQREIG